MAIRKCIPQVESYWGKVNPVGIRSCYDEGKRCAETLFFDYWRQHNLDIKVVRIFNTYGPRMHPNDGRVVSNFIVQALQGKDITIYGDGKQTRSFCYVDDLIEAMVRHDGHAGRVHRAGEYRQSRSNSPCWNWPKRCSGSTGSQSKIDLRAPALRRSQAAPARHLPGQGQAAAGRPKSALEDGLKETIAYFRKLVS